MESPKSIFAALVAAGAIAPVGASEGSPALEHTMPSADELAGMPRRIFRSGTRKCQCGRTISGNREQCATCSGLATTATGRIPTRQGSRGSW